MPNPIDAFTADLLWLGAEPEQRGDLVAYRIEPVTGRLAGQVVETAVEAADLAAWPIAPPHWVHLPASVTFIRTNATPSSATGWLRHSRQIGGWGCDADPAQAWLAHVRAVVGEAT